MPDGTAPGLTIERDELEIGQPPRGPESDPQLRWLPVDVIQPCPIQPRYNVSAEHVRRLSESMVAGLHEPVIEVEPLPRGPNHYQVVCGEQRWRAALEAGKRKLLVRVLPPLRYLGSVPQAVRGEPAPCTTGPG